jgi:hypothetical protein
MEETLLEDSVLRLLIELTDDEGVLSELRLDALVNDTESELKELSELDEPTSNSLKLDSATYMFDVKSVETQFTHSLSSPKKLTAMRGVPFVSIFKI